MDQKWIESLHRMPREERLSRVAQFCGLNSSEVDILSGRTPLSLDVAEYLIENVVGVFPIPMGVVTGLRMDGRDLLVPMAVEETSIIAAASATAKWIAKQGGTISTEAVGNLIIGQIQIPSVQNAEYSVSVLTEKKPQLIAIANEFLPGLVHRGGGVRDILIRQMDRADHSGKMMVLHVLCDPCDAMGANLINQVCEGLKPAIEQLSGEKVGLCILSNLVDGKLVRAKVEIPGVDIEVGKGVEEASIFAETDPYRATTHNKGILNGIDPILIATGNDWRAVEAGIHAYAARGERYQPVSQWRYDVQTGRLVGQIEIPMAVGTVGGVTRIHPSAQVSLKILGIQHASDLARVCAAVGLVQNLGALKALATVGIVKGHMQLHASNLAIAAGAEVHEIPIVRAKLTEVLKTEKSINVTRAREILESLRVELRPRLVAEEGAVEQTSAI